MMMPIESNRECFYLGMHYVHAFSRVLINHAYVSKTTTVVFYIYIDSQVTARHLDAFFNKYAHATSSYAPARGAAARRRRRRPWR
jgi:hypothetical protein